MVIDPVSMASKFEGFLLGFPWRTDRTGGVPRGKLVTLIQVSTFLKNKSCTLEKSFCMIIMVIDPKKAEKLILANIVIRCATSLVKIFMNDLSSTTCSTVSTTRITNMTLGLLRHVEEPVDDLPSVILCYCWMKAKKSFWTNIVVCWACWALDLWMSWLPLWYNVLLLNEGQDINPIVTNPKKQRSLSLASKFEITITEGS